MWKEHGITITYGDQSAELRELRSRGLLSGTDNFWSQQSVLRQLDRAYAAFFRRLQSGGRPGYPRFKSARRFSALSFSFSGNAGGVALTIDGRLYLQGIGQIKVKWHRLIPREATLRQVRILRKRGGGYRDRYYVCFQIELPDPSFRSNHGAAVGLDLGIRAFARLSTGEAIVEPRASKNGELKLRRLSRAYGRTRRGSKRRVKAANRLAQHRERMANQRRDAAHKASRDLSSRFSIIAVEDLNLRAMLRSAKGTAERPGRGVAAKTSLNREIADQGWKQFQAMLVYKAEEAGGRVIRVDPRGSSQTCSECAVRDRNSRHDAEFRCVACGHAEDADINAAQVLLTRAMNGEGPGRGLQVATPSVSGVT